MKYLPTLILIIVSLLCSTQTNGQTKILINEVATDVDQKNGDLLAIYKKYPNYMELYEKAPYDIFQKVPPRLSQLNIAETNRYVPVDPLGTSIPTVRPDSSLTTDNNDSIAEIVKSDKKKSNRKNVIYFVRNSSEIIKNSVPKFKSFGENIKAGDSKSVLLKGWFKKDDAKSQDLVQKRLEICKAELESFGVPSNLILTSILGSKKESRFVTIILQ